MKHIIIAEGSKSGKGGGYRSPVEHANTLQALQFAHIIDVVSEGPIAGLAESDKGIYLSETPLRTSGGALTMQDVKWGLWRGMPDQQSLPYVAASAAEKSVGIEVTKLYPRAKGPDSGKYQFSVSNTLVTKLRVTLGVMSLYETLTNKDNAGDIVPASVSYKVYVYNNKNEKIYETARTLKGKTMSRYLWELMVDLDGDGPWLATVEKTSADSTKSVLSNDLYLSGYTEIIGYSFNYPNTAMIGIAASAEAFGSSVPPRAYKIKGLIVKVPSNYDPESRTYTGIWDGSFKMAWTDNPAWVFYDLITNERYGVAYYLPWSYVSSRELCDKWTLYEIARICDELVPDGFGNLEPRYTFNYQIMGAADAVEVVQSVASVFHGMSFWSSGLIFARSDFPSDPVRTVNQTNVLEGKITYSTGSIQERHSVVHVTWNDPEDLYKPALEAVYDWDLIEKFGYNPVDTVAYGCTSRGQASRHGLWVLASEADDLIVTVRMGLDSFDYLPGDIVRIADPSFMGFRSGGRVKEIQGKEITLDAAFEPVDDETYTLVINTADGTEESRKVTKIDGTKVTVESQYSQEFAELPVWSILGAKVQPGLFAIQKISEKESAVMEIQLKEINPNKYQAIEQGLSLEKLPSQRENRSAPEAPQGLNIHETMATENGTLVNKVLFSWNAMSGSDFGSAVKWRVQTANPYGNRVDYPWQDTSSILLEDLMTGVWTFSVMGQSSNGLMSAWTHLEALVGGIAAPSAISGLRAVQDGEFVDLMWDKCPDINFSHYEIREGWTWSTGSVITDKLFTNSYSVPVSFEREYSYMVKAVNNIGKESLSAAQVSIKVQNLPDQNVYVAWDEFNNPLLWDEIDTPWQDYPAETTWETALIFTGTHEKTRLIENSRRLLAVEGTWEEQPDWTWGDYGGSHVLTLAEGETDGVWTSTVKDIGKVLSAYISHDVFYIAAEGSAVRMEVRTSVDDEVWSDWVAFIPRMTTLRYIQYRVVLSTENAENTPEVTRIYVIVDMPDEIRSGRQVIDAGGSVVGYGYEYTILPSVVLTADGSEKQAKLVGEPGLRDCRVIVVDSADNEVGGVINWTSRGY